MEKLENIDQLENKIGNLNVLINKYTLLKEDANNIGQKKSIEFFVNHMVKKKLIISEIIDDLYSSIITVPSEE